LRIANLEIIEKQQREIAEIAIDRAPAA